MQIVEMLMFILSIMMLIIIIRKSTFKKKYVIVLLSITILITTIHIIFGNTRWQLFTLYGVIVVSGIFVYLKTIMSVIVKKYLRITLMMLLSLLIAVSIFTVYAFPTYDVPKPSGDYLIGTESFVVEDENRIELYSENTTEYRRIKIQAWYPAASVEGYELSPWLEDGQVVARGLSKDFGLPTFILDHTVDILSNSYSDAPISNASESYPVIIISHGWRGFRNLHTDYAEELASLGYFVIGIDHSYGSVATVFSNDDIAYLNLDALPPRETTPDFLEYANQLVNTYALDVITTLNYLEVINDSSSGSRFSEKLDLSSIGLLGHSTGGGGDVTVALNDDRIDAIIGLDAWVEPIDSIDIDKGLKVPSLFLRSGAWETGENNTNLYTLVETSTPLSQLYQIDGTTHFDFAMVYMYSPLTKYIGFSGSVEGTYLNSMIKSMITDFFGETIMNQQNSEIDVETWDEVTEIIIP